MYAALHLLISCFAFVGAANISSWMEIPDHVDPPFRFMLTHHSGDVDPPRYV